VRRADSGLCPRVDSILQLAWVVAVTHPPSKGSPALNVWPRTVERLVDALHAAEAVLLRARTDHDQAGVAWAGAICAGADFQQATEAIETGN
jgi:hypothetical protein